MVPTKERRKRELYTELPWLKERDEEHLIKALERLATLSEQHKREVGAFRLYFCLDQLPLLTLREIGELVRRTGTTAGSWKTRTLRRLKHPIWKDESRWPAAVIKPQMSTMGTGRVYEIAVALQVRRYQSIGTERYISELKEAGCELGIKDAEMEQFLLAICDRIAKRW